MHFSWNLAEVYLLHQHLPRLYETGLIEKDITTALKISLLSELFKYGIASDATAGNIIDIIHSSTVGDLHNLLRYGKSLPHGNITTSDYAVKQCCHTVSALLWTLNQELAIFTGLSDKTHLHSWVVNTQGDIIEPTPIARDYYYGFPVEDPVSFVQDEEENIKHLAEDECIPWHVYETFKEKYAELG